MFTDYQMTPMSENFVDTFGFHDEEFNEAEDGIRSEGESEYRNIVSLIT